MSSVRSLSQQSGRRRPWGKVAPGRRRRRALIAGGHSQGYVDSDDTGARQMRPGPLTALRVTRHPLGQPTGPRPGRCLTPRRQRRCRGREASRDPSVNSVTMVRDELASPLLYFGVAAPRQRLARRPVFGPEAIHQRPSRRGGASAAVFPDNSGTTSVATGRVSLDRGH